MLTSKEIVLSCGHEDVKEDIFGQVRDFAVPFGTDDTAFCNALEPLEIEAMEAMEAMGYFKGKGIDFPCKYQVENQKTGEKKWQNTPNLKPTWVLTGEKKWKFSLLKGAYKSSKSQIVKAMQAGVAVDNETSRADITKAVKAKKAKTASSETLFDRLRKYIKEIHSHGMSKELHGPECLTERERYAIKGLLEDTLQTYSENRF